MTRQSLPDVHVFNVAIGEPEVIDGINGVLMPCVDQVGGRGLSSR